MMRNTPLQRRTPLKPSGAGLTRKPFKRRSPKKRPGYHEPKYLAACRGERCYLSLPWICCADSATVVPCHANWPEYGKGMGIKAKDIFTVPGCWRCHAALDQGSALTGDEKRFVWERAYERWAPARAAKMGVA